MHCSLIVLVVTVLLSLGCIFPRYGEQEDNEILKEYNKMIKEIGTNGSTALPVMTFNMRFDAVEDNPDNNFQNRLPRIAEMLGKWKPYIVGLQEPFATQVLHLKSVIPKHYKEIGYNRNTQDLGHHSRHNDFTVAILYDTRELELLESDFLWLSLTPRVELSKSWGSGDIRCLNIARFRNKKTGSEIVAMNTHLDRWGELARRNQASLVRSTIKEWKSKHPSAIFLLLGDFNAVSGQAAHTMLTSDDVMKDTWDLCYAHPTCSTNSISSTFHAWQGALLNTYVARIIQFFVFVIHGMGVAPPVEEQNWHDVAYDFVFNPFPLLEAIPSFPRMHIDFILFHGPATLEPKMISVVDVRSHNYSSDHFPIISLFEIKK